ncbi:MAG: hypothetical protein HS126_04110 [Anaerolineales bacterium]|nr:hypothetical protein [Anaerolineales bacterium]
MDSTTLLMIIGFIILLAVMYFFNRNRVARPGTYDDENYRSGGSIGGGQRTYDDPDYRSSGSIGGSGTSSARSSGVGSSSPKTTPKTRAYDDENYKSGGSIGG